MRMRLRCLHVDDESLNEQHVDKTVDEQQHDQLGTATAAI